MCLGSWHMIAKRSLKCVSSAKSTYKHNSLLMKFDYLRFRDFFIVTPWAWNYQICFCSMPMYICSCFYVSVLTFKRYWKKVISICFFEVWINVGIWSMYRYHFHFIFICNSMFNFSIHFKQSIMWFFIAIHQCPFTDSADYKKLMVFNCILPRTKCLDIIRHGENV